MSSRYPAVAGLFYPDDPVELRAVVRGFLAGAEPCGVRPRALIVPHAGYVYSGAVAATAFRALQSVAGSVARVVLLGPAHRVAFRGIATPGTDCFETPLGGISLDREAIARLEALGLASANAPAHRQEHSLEVQLPFLQEVLGSFSLVPLVVGDADAEAVADVLQELWDGRTLVIVSSDLSHYHRYDEAKRIDASTTEAIERCASDLNGEQACGCRPLNGLLLACRRRGLSVITLDLRNSGDTAGDRSRVVGYGAWAIQ